MKTRFSELAAGSCFLHGKRLKKKVADGRVSTISAAGRVRTKVQKGDPQVQPSSCPLRFIGVGMKKHPDMIVEVGDGCPVRIQDRKLKRGE